VEVYLGFLRSETIPDPSPGEAKPSLRRLLIETLETLLLSLFLFMLINAVSERIRVESISMQPNLIAGDFVIINKVTYRFRDPQRGEVIVFRYPPDPEAIPYIKRVIGLPGDQIHIADGKIYINGQLFSEPYLNISTQRGGDWSVPPGELFVMGDNRNNSSDSRSWGTVPLENVIGKAEVVYWPPENWRSLSFPIAAAATP
jgi:signal peptidase I